MFDSQRFFDDAADAADLIAWFACHRVGLRLTAEAFVWTGARALLRAVGWCAAWRRAGASRRSEPSPSPQGPPVYAHPYRTAGCWPDGERAARPSSSVPWRGMALAALGWVLLGSLDVSHRGVRWPL